MHPSIRCFQTRKRRDSRLPDNCLRRQCRAAESLRSHRRQVLIYSLTFQIGNIVCSGIGHCVTVFFYCQLLLYCKICPLRHSAVVRCCLGQAGRYPLSGAKRGRRQRRVRHRIHASQERLFYDTSRNWFVLKTFVFGNVFSFLMQKLLLFFQFDSWWRTVLILKNQITTGERVSSIRCSRSRFVNIY